MNKTLLTIAKLIASIALIYWVIKDLDLASIWKSIIGADVGLLAVAFILLVVVYLLVAIKQRKLLSALQVRADIPFLMQSYAVGAFFSNLLPSTIGGDASRIYDMWKVTGSKSAAVSVIAIDRIFGLCALISLGVCAIAFAPIIRTEIPSLTALMLLSLSAFMLVLGLIFGPSKALLAKLMNIPLGPFTFIHKISEKFIGNLAVYHGKLGLAAYLFSLSLAIQIVTVFHFALIAMALDMPIAVIDMSVIVPVVTILLLAPVTINGIGLRETIMVYLFGIYAVDANLAVAFAWISLGFTLLQGVIGGVCFAIRRTAINSDPT